MHRVAGFTLVELVVVVALAGVLTAVAVPALSAERRRTADRQMQADLRAVATRLETYFSDMNSYPSTLSQVGTTLTLPGGYTVNLSQGSAVSLTTPARSGSVDTFCLVATRTSGAVQGSQNWVWISDRGGQQPTGVSGCG